MSETAGPAPNRSRRGRVAGPGDSRATVAGGLAVAIVGKRPTDRITYPEGDHLLVRGPAPPHLADVAAARSRMVLTRPSAASGRWIRKTDARSWPVPVRSR